MDRRWWGLGLLLWTACAAPDAEPDARGVVSAASPEAARAGSEILEAGGNAIDAAVAVSFALGVTEPAMSGLGGQTQILFQRPGEEPRVINGTSYSPATTPSGASSADITGHRATTVPATVKSLGFAWREFGSGNVGWAALLAPAIRYADSGFAVGAFRHRVWQRHVDDLRAGAGTADLFLTANGTAPAEGTVWRQPVLAATLRRLAAQGADDFYQGEIAADIAADMVANGGWVTADDLRNVPSPTVGPAVQATYREYDVATLPPPGGGWVMVQILNLLELADVETLGPGSEDRAAHLARALRIAHRERRENPVPDLVDYEEDLARRISKENARRLWDEAERREGQLRDTIAQSTGGAALPHCPTDRGSGCPTHTAGETTHFTVVDADGLVVSVTASINAYFGARAASPTLGFLYNDYMHEFELNGPGHPFALRGSAMPYSSMSPTVISRARRPVLGLGSPGSARIISTVAQVAGLWMDGSAGLHEAVAAPRLHVVPDERLYVESEIDRLAVAARLAPFGFILAEPSTDLALAGLNAYFGGVHAVALEDDRWVGAADPRRDGSVAHAGAAGATGAALRIPGSR